MSRKRRSPVHGVLIVDKPGGMTSHDVVSCARKALGTRTVGHAGTLDPMATGVLVLGVGEGTKLLTFLTADDKEYRATVRLGVETDSLDADGQELERCPVPELTLSQVASASRAFVGTYLQRAPRVSALKKDGVALHERVRRGEDVEAPEREVHVRELDIEGVDGAEIHLRVSSAKGFYVRSLGRDLARALGTCGHLSALRRLRSGAFREADALEGSVLVRGRSDEDARAQVRGAMLSMTDAARGMETLVLDAAGVIDARHGRVVVAERLVSQPLAEVPAGATPHAPADGGVGEMRADVLMLLDEAGQAIAIARRVGEGLQVVRGFVDSSAAQGEGGVLDTGRAGAQHR